VDPMEPPKFRHKKARQPRRPVPPSRRSPGRVPPAVTCEGGVKGPWTLTERWCRLAPVVPGGRSAPCAPPAPGPRAADTTRRRRGCAGRETSLGYVIAAAALCSTAERASDVLQLATAGACAARARRPWPCRNEHRLRAASHAWAGCAPSSSVASGCCPPTLRGPSSGAARVGARCLRARVQVPRGPGSPPVPVMHSPPRAVSVKDQQDWKIPSCISNWKNPKARALP